MEERSGDGGAAGLELENGELVAMKRGGTYSLRYALPLDPYERCFAWVVKANMFRYI